MGCNVSHVLVPADLRGADIPAQKITSPTAGITSAVATKSRLLSTGGEAKPDIEQIVRGNVSLECPSTARVVRIFTSSTFTDTRHERNTLMKCVYPRLKAMCQRLGYDFQVVDMRWGVRDEATDDHMAAELCLKELDLCKKLSTGPCFITFLSHKYGYRYFPREIEAQEFSKLLEGVFDEEVKRLLLRWFKKDDNAIPSTYVLQPISSQIPEFLANDEERRKSGRAKWNEESNVMQWTLINAAYRQLGSTRASVYAMSLTEAEIRRGVLSSQDTTPRSVWFYRKIKDIDEQEPNYTLSRYTDCVGTGDAAEDSRKRMTQLRDNRLFRILPRENIVRYAVPWSPSGIDPDGNDTHKLYLTKLCQDVETKLSAMIYDAIQSRDQSTMDDPLTEEIIQHTIFCQEKCRAFQGRHDTLKKISYYIKDIKSTFPLILHGESGSGKTCIMAAAVQNTWRVLRTRGNIIIRFLGTTPDSSNIASLLTSAILQIRRIYDVDVKGDVPMDIKEVFQLFQETLSLGSTDRPLILFFDSLDQLDTAGGARQLMWLPRKLPENVKMVISTLTEAQHEIFPRLKVLFPTSSQYINIPKLSDEEVIHILDACLSYRRRQLTPSQRKVVEAAFQRCPLPLYLKMAIDQACQWRSFTPADVTVLHYTIGQTINAFFEKVEKIHGKLFVSRALGYLTISKTGLSDNELEDVLSCDDDVLNDVYTYWTPPIRRLPPLLLVRLKNELGNYLVDRGADGIRVFFWYHRLFLEAAKTRYCGSGRVCLPLHSALGDFFAGTWAEGQAKPFKDSKGTSETADRHVTSQPIRFGELYNIRKLNMLPFHRTAAEQADLLKKECLCNFEFILAKIRAVGVRQILDDMLEAHAMFPGDLQIQTVSEVLQLSQRCLASNPHELPSHIIGRIRRTKGLRSLVAQCQKAQHGYLLPNLPVLNPTGGPLLHCLAEHTAEVTGIDIMSSAKKMVTCSSDKSVKIWDVLTGKLLHSYDNVGERPSKVIICYKNTIVCVETASSLVAFEIMTGVQQRFKLDMNMDKTCVCSAGENRTRLAIFSGTTLKLRSARTGKQLGQEECSILENGEEFGQGCVCTGCNTVLAIAVSHRVILYDLPATQFYEETIRIPEVDQTMKDIVSCMAFCASDKRIVIGCGVSVTFYVIDLADKTIIQSLPGVKHDRMASFVRVTNEDRYLITASWEKIVIWDLKTSSRYPVLKHPTRAVTNVASVDGNIMASIASDAVVRIWDLSRDDASIHPINDGFMTPRDDSRLSTTPTEGQLVTPIQEIDDDFHISEIYLMTNPRYVLLYGNVDRAGVKTQILRVYDLATCRPIRQLNLDKGKSSYQVVMVGDRQTLVVEWTGKVRVLDLVTAKYVGQFSEYIPRTATVPQDLVTLTNFSEVLTLSEDRLSLKIFFVKTCRCTDTFDAGMPNKITGFVKNAAESTLVASTLKGPYLVFDLTARRFLYHFDAASMAVKNLGESRLTDDDRYLVCRQQAGDVSHLVIWELKTRRVHKRLAMSADETDNVPDATSLRKFVIVDNRTVMASYSDDSLRVHDLRSGQLLREVKARGGMMWIDMLPDSPYILTYNNVVDDNIIRIWDKKTLQCLASYSPDFRPIVTTMSKDGHHVLSSFRQMSTPIIWRMYSMPRHTYKAVNWISYPEIYGTTDIEADLSVSEVKVDTETETEIETKTPVSTDESTQQTETKTLTSDDLDTDTELKTLVSFDSNTETETKLMSADDSGILTESRPVTVDNEHNAETAAETPAAEEIAPQRENSATESTDF